MVNGIEAFEREGKGCTNDLRDECGTKTELKRTVKQTRGMLIRRRKQNRAEPKKLKKEGKPLDFSLIGSVRPQA